MSPEALQRSTFAAVRAVVARLAAVGPTVLALEDLHWADPTSVRLTEDLAALAAAGPLLVLVTRRPEPDPGVSDLESLLETGEAPCRFRRVELSPLPEAAERALITSLLGGGGRLRSVSGVEGNPLFLEGRFLSLVETGTLVRRDGAWVLSGLGAEVPGVPEVPSVLERLIRSRVDRVSEQECEVVEAASVGRVRLSAARRFDRDRKRARPGTLIALHGRPVRRSPCLARARLPLSPLPHPGSDVLGNAPGNGAGSFMLALRVFSRRPRPVVPRKWQPSSAITLPWRERPNGPSTTWKLRVTMPYQFSPMTRRWRLTATR